jgi:hypothetical protein
LLDATSLRNERIERWICGVDNVGGCIKAAPRSGSVLFATRLNLEHHQSSGFNINAECNLHIFFLETLSSLNSPCMSCCIICLKSNPDRRRQLLTSSSGSLHRLFRHPKRYYCSPISVSKSANLTTFDRGRASSEKANLQHSWNRALSIHRNTVVPASASGGTPNAAEANAAVATATAAVTVLCAPSLTEGLFFQSIRFGFKFRILQVFDHDEDAG